MEGAFRLRGQTPGLALDDMLHRCRLPSPKPLSSMLLMLGVLVGNALAAALSATPAGTPEDSFLFPSSPGLVFTAGEVVNVTFSSTIATPLLLTWCNPEVPRRANYQRVAEPFAGWDLVQLPHVEPETEGSETECWFSLQSDATGPSGADSYVFTIKSAGRDVGKDQMQNGEQGELRIRDSLPPTKVRQARATSLSFPSPTAQATTGPDSVPIQCPADHRKVFTDSDTLKRYVVLCDIDYHKDQGAKDIYNRQAASLNECIGMCAITQSCVGVGWGDYNGQNTCWLKSQLGTYHDAVSWYVAVEDPSQPGTLPNATTTGTGTAAVTNAVAASSNRHELSGDAKAGIGVGVTVGAVLAGVGCVLVWYRYQQKKLDLRRQEMLDRKLEVASSSDGGSASPYFNQRPPTNPRPPPPPTHPHPRSHSQPRSNSHPTPATSYGPSPRYDPYIPGGAGLGLAAGAGSIHNDEPRSRSAQSSSTAINHDVSGGRDDSARGISLISDSTTSSPHLAHVAAYIQQQTKRQQERSRGKNAPPSHYPNTDHPFQGTPQTNGMLSRQTTTAGMSIMTPSSGSIIIAPPWGTAVGAPALGGSASELPVREGYQGYGPEYEMSALASPAAPRPYRPSGGRDVDEQKFLLSDMASVKVRVLKPDDRAELG